MVPSAELRAPIAATELIRDDGRPQPAFRDDLRRIPSWRNAWSVAFVWIQTIGTITLAVWWNNPIGYVLAFLLMGRACAQLASLMHESAHRLLFANRTANDLVGRWLCGYPIFTSTDAYRRVHMAHHREEFGPDEPDIPLYRGYPISRASFRRKMWRDARGSTGWKLLRGQLVSGWRTKDKRVRHTLYKILAVQVLIATLMTVFGSPWMYPVLWLLPFLTVWRVINRLRSIAEHGGMKASKDRRETTHSVRQHAVARFLMVPYRIGWHLAHHVDSGIPFRNLPRYHQAMVEAGYVTPGLEYPSYPALWKTLRSG